MKRFIALFAAAMSLVACNSSSEVPFTEVKNYFFRNDTTIPSSPKIDSRMQNVRLSLQQIGSAMESELEASKDILKIKTPQR